MSYSQHFKNEKVDETENLKAYMILYDFIPLESAGGCWGGGDDGNDGDIHGTFCSLNLGVFGLDDCGV